MVRCGIVNAAVSEVSATRATVNIDACIERDMIEDVFDGR
jgi:hypothetical protein